MHEKVAKLPSSAFDAEPSSARNRQVTWVRGYMQKTKNNAIFVNIGHRGTGIEVAGLGGLEGMRVDNIKRHGDRFVFPHCHGVIVLKSGRVLNVDWATDQIPL